MEIFIIIFLILWVASLSIILYKKSKTNDKSRLISFLEKSNINYTISEESDYLSYIKLETTCYVVSYRFKKEKCIGYYVKQK